MIRPKNGFISDTIPPLSLIVFPTCYDNEPPAPVRGLKVDHRKIGNSDRAVLTWEPNKEKDICYYRIYRSEKPSVEISSRRQIASTISSEYTDQTVHNLPQYYYRVIAAER